VTTAGQPSVRPATPADVDHLYAFIMELAEYERAPEEVTGTPEMLADALFGPHPSAEALIAEIDGTPAGSAIFHGTFSTWECLPGIWLEDLYVPARHRRSGVGAALLSRLAELALERGCSRLEWVVLNWNDRALRFYERLGAQRLTEWEPQRLDGEALARVARGSSA
jgi:GNAT superfamily N-acetyltransferase